jgi:hypothetical protein
MCPIVLPPRPRVRGRIAVAAVALCAFAGCTQFAPTLNQFSKDLNKTFGSTGSSGAAKAVAPAAARKKEPKLNVADVKPAVQGATALALVTRKVVDPKGGSLSTGQKIIIGHVVVLGIGAAVAAKIVRDRRAAYASESEYLDSEIAKSGGEIDRAEAQLARDEAAIADHRRRVDRLEKEASSNRAARTEAAQALKQIDADIERNATELKRTNDEVEVLDEALESSRDQKSGSASVADLEQRRAVLTEKRDARLKQYERLVGISKGLQREKERVSTIVKAAEPAGKSA